MSNIQDITSDPLRLQVLRDLSLLEPSPEEAFDRLTRLAAKFTHSPVALVSIVDADRQFFKSCYGLTGPLDSARETPLNQSLCHYELLTRGALIITDAHHDERFRNHPAVVELGVVAYAGIPLVTSRGTALGSFCVLDFKPRDWTRDDLEILRTLAEAAMTEIELRLALREARYQLNEAKSQRRANQARDEFLNLMSHELRTPTATVLLWAKLISRGGLNPAETEEAVANIVTAAEHQSRLVNQLLDTAAILNGRFAVGRLPIELRGLVRSVTEAMRLVAEAKGLRLNVALPDLPLTIAGDEYRLRQVLVDVLDNAVKFTQPGGTIGVTLTSRDLTAVVDISDTGRGIATEFQPHLFERFRQADISLTREHGGLGLSLSIARHIVDCHQGTISARSEGKGKGTTIEIVVPMLINGASPPR